MAQRVYQLFANTDMDEGRGTPVPIPGLFANELVAQQASIGRGVYGSPADIQAVPVFETVDEFFDWEKTSDPEYREFLRLKTKFA